jgi:hypothetical protein
MEAPHRSRSLRPLGIVSLLVLSLPSCDDGDDDVGDGHGHATGDDGHEHGDDASGGNGDGHEHGGEDPCDDPRIDEFRVGMTAEGEAMRVTLLDATPSEPFRGDNAWTVSLTDLSGAPLEDYAVDVQPWMPDHGHGTSVGAEVVDRGDGELFVDPVNLWMAGLWEVRFLVTLEDATSDMAVLTVCVD